MKNNDGSTVIRISLRWVFGLAALVVIIGFAGGFLGSQLVYQPLPPLRHDSTGNIPAVQEITVSPNTNTEVIVEKNERAALVLALERGGQFQFIGFGIVLTNDGIIVTPIERQPEALVAIDHAGSRIALTLVGTDSIYGLTYYRTDERVMVPADLAQEDPAEGSQVVVLSRSVQSFLPRVTHAAVEEYLLPRDKWPIGWNYAIRHTSLGAAGAGLFDYSGRLVGIVAFQEPSLAIPVSLLRASLNRITAGDRELNPYKRYGLDIARAFEYDSVINTHAFVVKITRVVPRSPSAAAGLLQNDILVKIGEAPVTLRTDIIKEFSAKEPIEIELKRGSRTIVTKLLSPASP